MPDPPQRRALYCHEWKWRLNYETQPPAPGSAFPADSPWAAGASPSSVALEEFADLHHQGIGCLAASLRSILALRLGGGRHIADASIS